MNTALQNVYPQQEGARHDLSGRPADLQPDLSQARQFVAALGLTRPLVFKSLPEATSAGRNGELERVMVGALDDHADAFLRLNRGGAGIFVVLPAPHVRPSTARMGPTSRAPVCVSSFSCLRQPEPYGWFHDCLAIVESSSSRWDVYLNPDAGCDDSERRKELAVFASKVDAKSSRVAYGSGVLRLPGFYDMRGKPFMSRLALVNAPRVLSEAVEMEAGNE